MPRCPQCRAVLHEEDVKMAVCHQCGKRLDAPPAVTVQSTRPAVRAPEPTVTLQQVNSLWQGTVADGLKPDMSIKSRPAGKPGETTDILSRVTIEKRIVADREAESERPPSYRLLGTLGEGGMGTVYEARQTAVDRVVALKLIKPEWADDKLYREKFLSEGIATGDLEHPNVVPIYELGINQNGQLFYAMKRVRGTEWKRVIGQKSLAENLAVLMSVCNAVSYAHSHGVIHRDLKPDNVMLGHFGEVLVMDWGLAAAVTGKGKAAPMTKESALAGTPFYMPPETAKGQWDKIGMASDIYLLGAILYEIGGGKRPHSGETTPECLVNAANNVIEPASMQPEILDIAMKAMATEPDDRYRSVKAFQAAIQDYLAHENSISMSAGAREALERAERSAGYEDFAQAVLGFKQALALWEGNEHAREGFVRARLAYAEGARNKGDLDLADSLTLPGEPSHQEVIHRVKAALKERDERKLRLRRFRAAALSLAATVFIVVTIAYFWVSRERRRVIEAKAVAETERAAAESARASEAHFRQAAEYDAYVAQIGLAAGYIENGEYLEASRLVQMCAPLHRRWEWGYLLRLLRTDRLTVQTGQRVVSDIVLLPDQNRFLSSGQDGTIRMWRLDTGQPVSSIKAHTGWIHGMALTGGGRLVATLGADKRIALHDIETGRLLWAADTPKDRPISIAASPDGTRLATGHAGLVVLWDAATGTRQRRMKMHGDVISLAFSPDGKTLAAGGNGPKMTALVRLIDVNSGQHRCPLNQDLYTWIEGVSFADGGETLLLAGGFGFAGLLDLKTAQITRYEASKTTRVREAQMLPDGKHFVTVHGRDGMSILWARDRTVPLRVFRGHTMAIDAMAITADGRYLLTGGYDGMVKIQDMQGPEDRPVFAADPVCAWAATFSPHQRHIATGGHKGVARIWAFDSLKPVLTRWAKGTIYHMEYAPDGKLLMGGGDEHGWLEVLDADTYTPVREALTFPAAIRRFAIAPDGQRILVTYRQKDVHLFDLRSGQLVRTFEGHSDAVFDLAFFPDGKRFVSISFDGARVWEVDTGTCIWRSSGKESEGEACAVAYDGARFFAAGKLWDSHGYSDLRSLEGHSGKIVAAAFSPDGWRIATGGSDGIIKIWDVQTGRMLLSLRAGDQGGVALRFSEDGLHLITATLSGNVHLWRAVPVDWVPPDAGMVDAERVPAQPSSRDAAQRPSVRTPTVGSNLLENPGFEIQGSTHRSAHGWERQAPAGSGDAWGKTSRESWRSHSGDWEVIIPGRWGGGEGGGLRQAAAAEAGGRYEASAWFWADHGMTGVWTSHVQGILLEFLDGGETEQTLLSVSNCFDDVVETWTQKTVTAVAPAHTKRVRVVLFARGVGADGALQMDDAALRLLDPPAQRP